MPVANVGDTALYYEDAGDPARPAILALAPGGLDSQARFWGVRANGEPRNFPDPRPFLARDFRLITLDQRNAGNSRAPYTRPVTWDDYAADHLGLLDHLGIERFHILGACIGGPFGFKLIERAGPRVASFVVQATSGLDARNREHFDHSFDSWSAGFRARRPDVDPALLARQYQALFGADFIFSVDRDFVATVTTPLLILRGHDTPHPGVISDEIHALARDTRIEDAWEGEENRARYPGLLLDFFYAHPV
ncbi:alpha/beta fold hydrolase [Achromobacter aloeverae]|uniref:Alpha/beta hydrolase n=1 Tax=Achromobacter aloeverae TaxID=1750518 RepID=A0A4Q1HJR1_9BURK|nr:alpha/beta hydrolase [Achromobacter aloeverae]RXN87953.1 alpha/beta hydrolase [Achromobacter aloeverae]